jgi:uncharacterized protein YdhG (YjbR/CyaY superfamily)
MNVKENRGLSDEELSALKEHVQEIREGTLQGEAAVLEKISKFPEPDRSIGKKIHEIIRKSAPELSPRLWYGMPAYSKEGKVMCFFQPASKFKSRYSTLGFTDIAKLDKGRMWPVSFAVKEITPIEQAKISLLVKKALNKRG